MLKLLQGFAIGLALAAPVGPVGLWCIRRSLADGRLAGFLTGLGAAFADGVFGLVAALGLTAVTTFVARHETAFQLIGGIFLLLMGAATIRARPIPTETDPAQSTTGLKLRLSSAFVATFLIAIANPATITACLGIFTSFAADLHTAGTGQAFLLVLGIFLGSAAWWLILSSAAVAFGRRLSARGLRWIDLSAGLVVAAFGAWQLGRLAWR